MVMEDEKKKASGNEESVWKSMIEEVKKEKHEEPIEKSPSTKQEADSQNSIESKTIEEPIEKAEEKPKESEEKPKEAEKPKQVEKKTSKPKEKKGGKFTTIMLTRDLKEKMEKAKDPHESYGDFIKRLLEK